jgi:hypothetical protein
VASAFSGYNGTIFMYGQTGSGKTYTMLGDYANENQVQISYNQGKAHNRSRTPIRGANKDKSFLGPKSNEGILTLSMKEIFNKIKSETGLQKTYFVKCSYFEIYNDYIYDLLNDTNETLSINEDSNKEFYIKGLTEIDVKDIDSILSILSCGEQTRHYAETVMNRHSSRSHTIFRIVV